MKQCPRCNQTYTDDQLNFCLNDGEMLTSNMPPQATYQDDAPPTVMLNEARRTNPSNWPSSPPSSPPAQWQQPMNIQAPQFGGYVANRSPSQALAAVSLGLGIGSITIGWCCYIGVLLSPAALITGFLALSYIKKDPTAYGGRGFAIGGIVTGVVYFAAIIMILLIYGAALLGRGFN